MLLNQFVFRIFGFLSHRDFGNKFLLKYNIKASKEQESQYISLGLDRSLGLMKLNTTLYKLYGKTYSETNGMWSEHLILFSAISESSYKIETILEIGTFNGETTRILSHLFPLAAIETYDLPLSDIEKDKKYKYAVKNKQIIKERQSNFKDLQNVQFIENNSILITQTRKKYDLVWLDGDHSYPVVTIDIFNSIKQISKKGLVICDDVYVSSVQADKSGRSSASFETLTVLNKVNLISYVLIQKRLGFFYNYPKSYKKYLGIFWL
jgi:predicted O-methyltransferase YrrM